MTSPQNGTPRAPKSRSAAHRRTSTPGPQPTAAPSEPARPEPERFNGFVPRGQQPAAAPADNGNRGRPTAPGSTAPGSPTVRGGSASELVERLRALGAAQRVESRPRWTRRRRAIASVITVGVVIVLLAAGAIGYKLLAPYYGLGYQAGGSTTIQSIKLTVTKIDCGLSDPPFGQSGTPRGKYCGITVAVHNKATYNTAFVTLNSWTCRLDVDLTVAPLDSYLRGQQNYINAGQTATFDLTYDIPDGARIVYLSLSASNLGANPVTRHVSVS